MAQYYTHQQTLGMVRQLPALPGKVYGVRRMAVPLAYAYCALHGNDIVEDAEEADIIIDDTMGGTPGDMGRTYRRMNLPNKIWLVLIYNPACGIPLGEKVHCVVQGIPQELPCFPVERDLIRSEFGRGPQVRNISERSRLFSSRAPSSTELGAMIRNSQGILVLEDLAARAAEFRTRLAAVTVVDTAAACIAALERGDFDLVFLDHDLENDSTQSMPVEHTNTGSEVARHLATMDEAVRPAVIVHSQNPDGAEYILRLLPWAKYRPHAEVLIPRGLA